VFSRILVAYDDSPAARRALAEAVRIARQDGARLVAVAVEEHLPRYDGATIGEVEEAHQLDRRACHRWLRAAEAYADEQGVRLRTEIRIGRLTRQLALAAASHQVDLLVVGHTSHVGVWCGIVGTKAERVCRRVGCAILIAS
jgi:universal stress protein F